MLKVVSMWHLELPGHHFAVIRGTSPWTKQIFKEPDSLMMLRATDLNKLGTAFPSDILKDELI